MYLAWARPAGAFWPFAVANADNLGNTPVLHDPSLNLLTAPLSTNVEDVIDGTALTTPDGTSLVSGGDSSSVSSSTSADSSTSDKVTAPSSGTISQYTVKSGDSLSKIAENFGVSVNTILWANNIKDISTIKQGTVLVILPVSGIQHKVHAGETLSSIASKFSADASDIAQFNGLADGTALTTGSIIIIPGGELSTKSISDNVKSNAGKSTSKTKNVTDTKSQSQTRSQSSATSDSNDTSGKINYSEATHNPYKGGSGAALHSFFSNPVPGALLTQGVHGWNGVDLGAHTGTPILAAASGSVILSRSGGWNGGYGNYVIIDHGNGVETLYAHMSENKAEVGSSVSAGEVIGYVGTTGEATGPHVHFEVRGARNPFAYCIEMAVCSPK